MSDHNTPLTVRCPTCKNEVTRDNSEFPFCSSRCRTTDLGRWASGEYRIAGESVLIPDESDDQF